MCGEIAPKEYFVREEPWDIDLLQAENGYPGTQGYSLTECLFDLLGTAARTLCLGVRLVYFLPAAPGTCEGVDVPQHPTLRVIANCEQVKPLPDALLQTHKCVMSVGPGGQ